MLSCHPLTSTNGWNHSDWSNAYPRDRLLPQNPFKLLPPQFLSHLLVFILFKQSALRKNSARHRLLVPSFMFKGKFLYLRQLKYQFQWVNIILELLKRTKAHAKMWTHMISNEMVLFEWGSVTCRLSGSRTKNNKKHVTPPQGIFFPANPGKIKERTWLQIWSKN